MADIILCPNGSTCNCLCNCQGFFSDGRRITVESIEVLGNQYTFNYILTNPDPDLSFIVFCIQCPLSVIEINDSNTAIALTGNPNGTPVIFTQCFTPGCESSTLNSFYVEYEINNEQCCKYQGFKIELNVDDTITEIRFQITFTLPVDVVFGYNSGSLKIKYGQNIEYIYNICVPGCAEGCDMLYNICNMWQIEKNILEANKKTFIHFAQLLFPDSLDLSTLTVQELENIIRAIAKLEKSTACLICNIAKILEKLNEINGKKECTLCG